MSCVKVTLHYLKKIVNQKYCKNVMTIFDIKCHITNTPDKLSLTRELEDASYLRGIMP